MNYKFRVQLLLLIWLLDQTACHQSEKDSSSSAAALYLDTKSLADEELIREIGSDKLIKPVVELNTSDKTSQMINISEAQSHLYNRIKSSKYINNPYKNLNISQICSGTSSMFSSGNNDYQKWKAIYTNCVYVDGNLEIVNFDPYSSSEDYDDSENMEYQKKESQEDKELDRRYDFSFLDNIKEITGYLLIHKTRLRNLTFKSLQLVRGKNLISDKYSVFIETNYRLEKLDLTNLREVQRGSVYIQHNPALCHMNQVIWDDIVNRVTKPPHKDAVSYSIDQNADPDTCSNCSSTCCSGSGCACWFPEGCQNLTKVICHPRCEGRCYGPGPFDCCNKQCLGGCMGPNVNDCFACKSLRIAETGECVDSCPRIQMADPQTGELVYNPNGLYQYGITCVKFCPINMFIYQDFCLSKCPNKTYEDEEMISNPETGERGIHRVCKPCTPEKCPKTCSLLKPDKNEELNHKNLKSLEGCEVLNSNLLILQPEIEEIPSDPNIKLPPELSESDLQVLSSLRVINGFVRIQSNKIKSLSFLRNLEVVRATNLVHSRFSMVIFSKSLRTLGLNKLKKIEKGEVYFKTEQLCLSNTIDWKSIVSQPNSLTISQNETMKQTCEQNGYVCDPACAGCWSTGPKSCQFCKAYKLADICVESCNGTLVNNSYIYLQNEATRECKFCHSECEDCNGPTEYDCLKCKNLMIPISKTAVKCVNQCPITHYAKNQYCLPCDESCFGCTGPRNVIAYDGCIRCSSALVDNDPVYTVLKCIIREEFNCTGDYFWDLVPSNLKNHPLKGKAVCRRCHKECDGCFKNGAFLNTQCERCMNYYSKSTNECVNDCANHNQYLEDNTKNCLPCDSECKSGCSGSANFECRECRSFRLHLKDAQHIIQVMSTQGSMATEEELAMIDSFSFSQRQVALATKILNELVDSRNNQTQKTSSKTESLIALIESYRRFYQKQRLNSTDVDYSDAIFCISECPALMPFQTIDLFCTSAKSSGNHQNYFMLILILSVFIVVMLVGSFVVSGLFLRYLNKRNEEKLRYEEQFFSPDDGNDDQDYGSEKKTVNMAELRLIQINDLEKGVELGKGAFGTVYEGNYIAYDRNGKRFKIKVAIKELNKCKINDENGYKELTKEIINEAKLMASVNHKYCLQLSALCLAEPIMMISQLMRYGSVVSFMQKYRDNITEKMMLVWAQQIAEGMSYLESRNIVHRDLAARNILVKAYDHIKITDFGLAKMLESNKGKGFVAKPNSLVPVKWMAIESIKHRLFTHRSDVWSYGVCLWEIFTFCAKPYAELDPIEVANSIIKGIRLSKPQIASIDIYTILLRCWLEKPFTRPSFKELSDEFEKMALEPRVYLSLKDLDPTRKFITINENSRELMRGFRRELDEDFEDKEGFDDYLDDKDDGQTTPPVKKLAQRYRNNTSQISPDEGIDLNSTEMTSSTTGADVVYTTSSDSSLNVSEKLNQPTNRKPQIKKKNHYVKESAGNRPASSAKIVNQTLNHLRANPLYLKNPNTANIDEEQDLSNEVNERVDRQVSNGGGKNKNSVSNLIKRPSNFSIFKIFGNNNTSSRLNSQVSNATGSTYVSSQYSDMSEAGGGHSPLLLLSGNSQNYEEQQALLSSNAHSTRSNSDGGSSCSHSVQSDRSHDLSDSYPNHLLRQSNRNKFSQNTNSDYLEPVTYNIKENTEYFGNIDPNQVKVVPDRDENKSSAHRAYYNDDLTAVLLQEQQKRQEQQLKDTN